MDLRTISWLSDNGTAQVQLYSITYGSQIMISKVRIVLISSLQSLIWWKFCQNDFSKRVSYSRQAHWEPLNCSSRSRRYFEMPQKACERYIFHVMAYSIFFEMTHFIFGSFSVLQLTACIFFEIPRFFMFVFFSKCLIFPIWFWKWEKRGHFEKMNIKKRGISNKNARGQL